jgi:hypothetical protein
VLIVTTGVGSPYVPARGLWPVTVDLHSVSVLVLIVRHEPDAAVAVPRVLPIDKRCHPLTSGLLAGERTAGVVRPVFRHAEQRLGIEDCPSTPVACPTTIWLSANQPD